MQTLPPEMIQAMRTLFSHLASDTMAFEGNGVISGDFLVELILDADRLETNFPNIDWTLLRELSYLEQVSLTKQVFPGKYYG